jgi:hypothetical protein
MIPVFLWIVCCYTLAAVSVHAAYRIHSGRKRKGRHYVLVAGNQQLQMEWVILSLRWFSRRTGTEVKITVIDGGSEDETLAIAEHFAKAYGGVRVRRAEGQGYWRHEGYAAEGADGDRWSYPMAGNDADERSQGGGGANSDEWPDGPLDWIWMLQMEGVVEEAEHAVLIDLRDPGEYAKLPF